MKYFCYTSKPFGDILRYSLTSLLFSITFMFSMSIVVYEYGLSGIKTRKEILVCYILHFQAAFTSLYLKALVQNDGIYYLHKLSKHHCEQNLTWRRRYNNSSSSMSFRFVCNDFSNRTRGFLVSSLSSIPFSTKWYHCKKRR